MRILRSSRFWLLAFAALLLFSSFAMIFMGRSAGGSTAIITQNNVEIERIDLSKVKESYTIRVENPEGGYNMVLVEKGKISVFEASCPDKICVNQGKISDSLKPIVCLPNRVMVLIEGAKAETGADVLAG